MVDVLHTKAATRLVVVGNDGNHGDIAPHGGSGRFGKWTIDIGDQSGNVPFGAVLALGLGLRPGVLDGVRPALKMIRLRGRHIYFTIFRVFKRSCTLLAASTYSTFSYSSFDRTKS